MKKLRMDPDTIPDCDTSEEGDDDSDEKAENPVGHIGTWWAHLMRLPPEVRPVFTPTAGFRDSFTQFSESALISILWGYAGTKTIMETICTRQEAERLSKTQYGELLRRLFVGDRATIKNDPFKRQTNYGRRTRTIGQISEAAPDAYGADALEEYRCNLSNFYEANEATAQGNLFTGSPPNLPQGDVPDNGRYALSNYLVTNGLQVHLRAFDIAKTRTSQKKRIGMQALEQKFPDAQSITRTFGSSAQQCAVIGVDPGERVSASFCGLSPRTPNQVTNLAVRRSALYSPTLRHRRKTEQMKRRRPVVDPNDEISPAIWTSPAATGTATMMLPSIQEIEGSLHSSDFQTIGNYQDGLRQFFYVWDVLTGFYGSKAMKKANWEKDKARRAEFDWAVNGAIHLIEMTSIDTPGPALVVYGNARFNTHTNLSTLHDSFKGYFYLKATSYGINIVSTDEYLTSTKCPSCTAKGRDVRMAKPGHRSCVCLDDACKRWVDRDAVGAHNLANIGRAWLDRMIRPQALTRPTQPL
jgi:hypothetical protein